MKTYIFATLISAFLNPAYFFAHVPAFRFTLEEEAYVEDLDFESESVVFSLATKLNEESYVNDIPFNTYDIAVSAGSKLPEEAYVDDIPFDTYEMAMNLALKLPEEAYVDDIPFDTECVVNNQHKRSDFLGKCLINKDKDSITSASAYRTPIHEFALKPEIL